MHADNSQRADESHHGWWKLGRCNPFFNEELNSRADEVMATVAIDEDDDEDEEMLEGEENGLSGELDGLAGVIAEALADIGGEGTVETIVEAVSVQWNQEDDCQTVVEAFFAAGDHALFKLDPKQEGVWLLTKQGRAHVAEMAASSPDESEEEPDSSDPAGDPMEVDEDVNGDRDEREEAEAGKSSGRVKREKSPSKPRIQRVTRSRVKTSDSSRADKRNTSSAGSASPAGPAGAYPTQLQERIKDLIVDSGGSCNGDFIINTITEESSSMTLQARRELLGTDEDARKVVTMVLTAPKKPADQLFKRDVNSDGSWMLSRKGLRAWVRSPATGEERQGIRWLTCMQPDAPPTSNIPLTDMQAEIVQIIALNGGRASIKSILNEVPKSTIKMRRREAGTDFAKAIRTCLTTSMSSGKPMFKKASNKEDVWKVADKTVQEGVLQRYDNVLSKRRSKSPSPAAPSAKRKKR